MDVGAPTIPADRLRALREQAAGILLQRAGCACLSLVEGVHRCGDGHEHPTAVFLHTDVKTALDSVAPSFPWTPFLMDPTDKVMPDLTALEVMETFIGHGLLFVVLADEGDTRLRSLVLFPKLPLRLHHQHLGAEEPFRKEVPGAGADAAAYA